MRSSRVVRASFDCQCQSRNSPGVYDPSILRYSEIWGAADETELKGQCHENFCFRFYSWFIFPQAPENFIMIISKFLKNIQGALPVSMPSLPLVLLIHWQIIGTISDCWHLKVNLKEKMYLYVNSTIQRCPNKIIKTFMIEDFYICRRCQRHRWCTLSCKYLLECSKIS